MTSLPIIAKEEIPFETNNHNSNQDKKNSNYDYFQVKISKRTLESLRKLDKDERYGYFLTNGVLRRFEGEGETLYIEIPQIPNNIVVYRRPMIRNRNKEKLNLNKKSLPHIPLLEGEEGLKLLSLESNLISKIDHLISLNSLLFLNLYENKIREIDNLSTVPKLKVLMLGKNIIERIQNLSCLQDLEILDLHSNKIKLIENLTSLKQLKVLNLANNQITSFCELMSNKSLEDLNLRRNLIASIPNMTHNFEKMRKMNLEKNMIAKLDFILELNKLKLLEEVYIEENPVLSLKNCYDKLMTLPLSLQFKDQLSRDSLSNGTSIGIGNARYQDTKRSEFGNSMKTSRKNDPDHSKRNMSRTSNRFLTYHSNNFSFGNFTQKLSLLAAENKNGNSSNEERSKLLLRIKTEWDTEYQYIIDNGFNGYNMKKLKETKLQSCHAELKREKQLNLFGNAMEVLDYNEFHSQVDTIQLQYFNFDVFAQGIHLNNLKKFINLKSLILIANNLHSLYQLLKIKDIKNVEYITIKDNEINASAILKYFLIYRMQTLKVINDSEITSKEIILSKKMFETFDQAILHCGEEKWSRNRNHQKKDNANASNDNIKVGDSENKEYKDNTNNDTLNSTNQKVDTIRTEETSINKQKEDNGVAMKYSFIKYLKENLYLALEEVVDV